MLVGLDWVGHPHTHSDPATKEYVDGEVDPLIIKWELFGSETHTSQYGNAVANVSLNTDVSIIQESKKIKLKVKISGSNFGTNNLIYGDSRTNNHLTVVGFNNFTSSYSVEKEFIFFNAYDVISSNGKSTAFYSEILESNLSPSSLYFTPTSTSIYIDLYWENDDSKPTDVVYEISLYRSVN